MVVVVPECDERMLAVIRNKQVYTHAVCMQQGSQA